MNGINQNEQTYEQAVNEMEKAYVLYACWSHELGFNSPIVDELYSDWWYARKKVEDIYASMTEA